MTAASNSRSRRRFLQGLLAGAAAAALAPARRAFAGDPAEFAAGLAERPWLAGWKSVAAEALGPAAAERRGRLPEGLAGTLYRNGPAWTERAGFRYEHWFDGDGMVHAWRLGQGQVRHRARMVATPKFRREQAAGRFLLPAAGTTVPGARPGRNNDDGNTANTAVTTIGGRLFALWEGGSAFELDPDSLDTLGPVTWRPDLAALPFSAHPLRERDGTLWNFGATMLMGGGGLLLWRIGADGALRGAHVLDVPEPGYLHSFAMTERHLVFVLMPFRFEGAGAFFQRLRFAPDRPCRVAVVAKAEPERARWFEADFAAVYHFGDACERGGEIVVRAVQHPDPEEARSPMREAMRGHAPAANTGSRLADLHLDLRGGRARWRPHDAPDLEFPLFDPRTPGDRGARLYAPVRMDARAPYFDAVAMLDPARGRRQVHRYGAGVLAEEHVFVPRPGSTRADDGWLVGTLLDARRGRSGLAVLDARRVDAGPLLEAWLPYAFPLGFHGHFAAA
ncbi:carotenoid oxygenase family protein [Vulcaniibacterium tengchongense]|uniref:Carotenoid cleavage dioxygenase-like enzyme n=1 Tax=Vulcaniibacterium tengchongense TaxID=1273429 RepID=A0A3N4VSV0_9GAMM|nr:carotenoid oxygenase family protein [Vulcaniibacterium tengchongense]RPE80147.1 carotenoid cleavage dioxygenase-like enzyme [Vulcaniibacterium tengchongense]